MFNMNLVFFGLWYLLTSYLSGFIPRLAGVGELIPLLWLLVKGVDSQRWHECARALNRAFSEN
jgi:hypothetical protein